jgi:hypothetical protein
VLQLAPTELQHVPKHVPLQHWVFLVHVFPLRLHLGGSAEASVPMPRDPAYSLRLLPHKPESLASRESAIG